MFFNLSPVPNLPPANIRAIGASSSSINITWDAVPKDGRNGVVLGYKVRVLKFNVAHYGPFSVLFQALVVMSVLWDRLSFFYI